MPLRAVLDEIQMSLKGRSVTDAELAALKERLPDEIIPKWLLDTIAEYPLTGANFSLSEEKDESKQGVEMRWLSPDQIIYEGFHAYPGIAAIRKRYLPIGSCLEGSGDPYFLKIDTSLDPPVVRIPHEVVDSELNEVDESRIEVVSSSLSKFLQNAALD